jgi:hypothetical protein
VTTLIHKMRAGIARLGRDQRGTTLAELIIGMAAGLTVMFGLSTLVVVTFNNTTRVSARVGATQQARVALDRVVNQLHSACIAPKVPPIRKESSGSQLRFVHATGAAVAPTPVLSVITHSGTTLTQSDYEWQSGAAPFWTFKTTPYRTTKLADRINPIGSRPIFSYYGYASGALSTTPFATPLSELNASYTIQVTMAFMASPRKGKDEDSAPARIQGSAGLRLTASSYNPAAPSLPCQ